MKKANNNLKKVLFIILLSLFICSGQCFVLAGTPVQPTGVSVKQETTHKVKKLKRNLIKLLGIACVGCCIYIAANAYKNFKKVNSEFDERADIPDNNSYQTPSDLNGAIKLFLNKLK